MRYLVLSDVHANAVALAATLRDAERRGFDATLFLGDAVGYYPAAQEAVDRLAALEPEAALLGNHDAQLLSLARGEAPEGGSGDPTVRRVLEAQLERLDDDALAWLGALRERYETDAFEAVHGALARPWQYLDGLPEARENLPHLSRPLCLVGHTHVPRILASVEGPRDRLLWRQVAFPDGGGGRYRMPPRARGFFNPGSVGQPRDGAPLAAYGLLDVETRLLEVVRVPFDVVAVQREVRAAGYPDELATRLADGR